MIIQVYRIYIAFVSNVLGGWELSHTSPTMAWRSIILLAAAMTDGVANNTEPLVYVKYLSHGCLAA